VANLIRQVKPEQIYSLMQTHTKDIPQQRMTTLERSLVELVRSETILPSEAERTANRLPEFLAAMQAAEE